MHPQRPDGTAWKILELLKRRGSAGIPELAGVLELSPESVRAHVRTLVDHGHAEDVGARIEGRGRPERLYAVTRAADAFFPRREAELLRGLAEHLRETGHDALLATFLERFATERLERARDRLRGLEGEERLAEVARILTEEGYMAEVSDLGPGGAPRLRLCHCPVRELVEVSRAPCRAEVRFVKELVGDTLARVEYIPDGDAACAYAVGEDVGA